MRSRTDTELVTSAVPSIPVTHTGIDWKWTSIAVLLGVPLISTFTYIVAPEIPRPDVAILIGALTFLFTGMLLGFKSPGTTILEGLAAGGILAVLTGVVLIVGLHASGRRSVWTRAWWVAASGILAANHLLAPWDVKPEPLWSVPLVGPLARRR